MPLNILFLTLLDFQSLEESNIYTDLMSEFVKNNHDVSIISPVERKKRIKTHLVKINDKCEILKLRIGNIQKTNLIEKGFSTIQIERKFISGINQYFSDKKFDLVIYSTPPVTFAKVVKFIKKRDNCKSYLLLKDIFPQNAVDLNQLSKKSYIYKYFRKKEVSLYEVSDYIGTMSEQNSQYIRNHNKIDKQILEVNPNSIRINENKIGYHLDKEKIKNLYKIPKEKTIMLYGGNLGKPQGIDFLLNIISRLEKDKNFLLLIIGSGTEYGRIRKHINTNNIKNTILIDSLSKNEYKKVESIADIGLVFLDKKFTIPNIPSRILGYMESKKPILAAVDKHTDLNEMIKTGKFGYCSEHGDLNAFLSNMERLKDEKVRNELGRNAFIYLKNNFDVKRSYTIIMNHFEL
ncbi:glycosyltransferase family 4 protein [Enterococcus durans]|uniref:glycosyltransferase family 4 protein n=1 Tax=Enterococcus durans TaxID=53345 RepID=UPI001EDE98F5|nr:glycosyltransferase family 4 protein [Enterococcus durans]MCG3447941.1 glycosyltransferase family 4 protein [Enterococcus durans]